MMASARRAPLPAISASVSCRNGCQFRMPTNTGNAGPPCASVRSSARAWENVRSASGERLPGISS
jgi:hypothetical protein